MQQLYDSLSRFHIKISRRLVRQNDSRRVEHGTRYHDTLLFAAGELIRQLIPFVAHADQLQHLFDAFFYLHLVLPAGSFKHEFKIIVDGTIRQQLEILKHDAELTPQLRNIFTLDSPHIISQNLRFTVGNIEFTIKCFQ